MRLPGGERPHLLLFALSACVIDSNATGKPDGPEPFDTGAEIDPPVEDTSVDAPGDEECNGPDDDGDGAARWSGPPTRPS